MQTRVLTTFPAVEALEFSWRALFDVCQNASTFCSYEWLANWYRAYQPQVSLRVVVVEHGGQVVGIAPLVIRRVARYGLRFPALFMLGDGVESDHAGFLVHPEFARQVMPLILDQIELLPWRVAHLNQIPEGSETATALLDLSTSKNWCVQVDKAPCPYRVIPSSYQALLDSMQSRFRSTLRSTRRNLGEKYRVKFGLHDDEVEFPGALDALFRNHKSRWAAKGQAGVFENEQRRLFYQLLTQALSRRGWLRFFYLALDDRIVAQEYCFERDGTIYLLQEGFDYSFAEANIGHALRSFVMEWLIVHEKRCYDFLVGTSRHKQLWSSASSYDLRITIGRNGIAPLFYVRAPIQIEKVKEKMRRAFYAIHLWAAIERLRKLLRKTPD